VAFASIRDSRQDGSLLPAWATVLIAIGASAVGGVLGAWLQTEHDRRQRFRDRMIEAADDYNQAFTGVLSSLSLDRRAEAEKRLGEAMQKRSRVDLLFSPDSVIREAAQAAIESAWVVVMNTDAGKIEDARNCFYEAEDHHKSFLEFAYQELRGRRVAERRATAQDRDQLIRASSATRKGYEEAVREYESLQEQEAAILEPDSVTAVENLDFEGLARQLRQQRESQSESPPEA
jgi:hypothetical protein